MRTVLFHLVASCGVALADAVEPQRVLATIAIEEPLGVSWPDENARKLREAGVAQPFRDWPRLAETARYLAAMHTPFDPRYGSRQKAPIGDTSPGNYVEEIRALADDYRGIDDTLAAGFARFPDGGPDALDIGSRAFPGFGAMLRGNAHTSVESFVTIKAGPARNHFQGDVLSPDPSGEVEVREWGWRGDSGERRKLKGDAYESACYGAWIPEDLEWGTWPQHGGGEMTKWLRLHGEAGRSEWLFLIVPRRRGDREPQVERLSATSARVTLGEESEVVTLGTTAAPQAALERGGTRTVLLEKGAVRRWDELDFTAPPRRGDPDRRR